MKKVAEVVSNSSIEVIQKFVGDSEKYLDEIKNTYSNIEQQVSQKYLNEWAKLIANIMVEKENKFHQMNSIRQLTQTPINWSSSWSTSQSSTNNHVVQTEARLNVSNPTSPIEWSDNWDVKQTQNNSPLPFNKEISFYKVRVTTLKSTITALFKFFAVDYPVVDSKNKEAMQHLTWFKNHKKNVGFFSPDKTLYKKLKLVAKEFEKQYKIFSDQFQKINQLTEWLDSLPDQIQSAQSSRAVLAILLNKNYNDMTDILIKYCDQEQTIGSFNIRKYLDNNKSDYIAFPFVTVDLPQDQLQQRGCVIV